MIFYVRQHILIVSIVFLAACGDGDSDSDSDTPLAYTTSTLDIRAPSVARQWNDVILDAIRIDFARPTVHARNLFHLSAAMYDAWAAYDDTTSTYLLGQQVGNHDCGLTEFTPPNDIHPAREEAISYAVY